jgi:CBS domain-containing protein
MSTGLITIAPDANLDECLGLMEKHRIFHLLVVNPPAGYLGMVSIRDLLKVIASDQKARADLLESYIFPPR